MKLPNTRWQKVVQVSLWNSINFVACSVSFTILMCTFSSVIAQREWETIPQVNCLKCHPSGSLLHWMYVGHYSKTSCGVNSINKIFSVAIFLINIFLYNHYDNFAFNSLEQAVIILAVLFAQISDRPALDLTCHSQPTY